MWQPVLMICGYFISVLGIAMLFPAVLDMYYTGINPETGEKVFVARNMKEKEAQRRFFFWYKPEERKQIAQLLRQMKRPDLAKKLGI